MGHLGNNNLKRLEKLASGINLNAPIPDQCTCRACLTSSMIHRSHTHPTLRGTYPMELIHTDVVGPIPGSSFNGARYFVHFTCDRTKLTKVYTMCHKNEAPAKFKEFQMAYERPDRKVHRLRSDNGEMATNDFQDFMRKDGILWEPTNSYNPQQNGASESVGGKLWRMTVRLLEGSAIPKGFWPEIVKTAAYLKERSPHAKLDTTPHEAFFGIKPDLSNLRCLGSEVYELQGGVKQKLLDKSIGGFTLTGFEGSKFYRYVDLESRNPVIKRGSDIHIIERIPVQYENLLKEWNSSQKLTTQTPREKIEPDDPRLKYKRTNQGKRMPAWNIDESANEEEESFQSLSKIQIKDFHKQLQYHAQATERAPSPEPELEQPIQAILRHPELQRCDSPDELALICTMMVEAKLEDPSTPKTYKEAVSGHESQKWEESMKDELNSLLENNTWELVDLPPSRQSLSGKWVYKRKKGGDGEILRYKSRWVVRGFEQQEGIDYQETFASVIKPMSYKIIFALVAAHDWELEQMDVKTAFLYGTVDEDIYVEQIEGFDDKSGRVCKLKKALYGLKQAPRVWYQTISRFLHEYGLTSLAADSAIFTGTDIIVGLFVDDIIIVGPDKEKIQKFKEALSKQFKMTDLGPCKYYLGMTIERDRPNRVIRLGQEAYLRSVLKDFGMEDSKSNSIPIQTGARLKSAPDEYEPPKELVKWYQGAIGSLMYAMLGTRPDIAFAVSVMSRFAAKPLPEHKKIVQGIFRYLKGSLHLKLTFRGALKDLTGYTDSDWSGCQDTRRSTSGYIFMIGSAVVSWSAKRQATVALSSCESEYIGYTQAAKEAIWLRMLLQQLDAAPDQLAATVIWADNQGAIAMAKNPKFHARCKHIATQHHFVREKVESGEIDLQYVCTKEQIADGLTKPLGRVLFTEFRERLGLE